MGDKQKIAIWGTGNIARKFFYERCYRYDTQYFIDNYEPKYRIKNYEVYYPNEVDLKQYMIIIAIADWQSVAEQLEEMGLSFYKDYLPYELLEKDEIPIIDILARIDKPEDREKVILEYQCNKKVALINGNCQTTRIKMYLKQNREFSKEYVFLDIPALYELTQDQTDLLLSSGILKEVELFISQNISLNNAFDYRLSNEHLIGFMSCDVHYVRIPNLFFDIYFPQGGKEQDPVREDYIREIFPYNDAFIDELAKKEGFSGGRYTADEIIQIISIDNLFSDDFLSWVIQYRLKQLKEREADCDIKMMDYIENNYLKEQLFYSRNHPINKVLKEESIRILKYINPEWNTDIEHEETIPSLSINQEFIYPSIFYRLKPAFIKKWYSDTISECRYSIEDEIKKYLFCCHNKFKTSLKEGLSIMNALDKMQDHSKTGGAKSSL